MPQVVADPVATTAAADVPSVSHSPKIEVSDGVSKHFAELERRKAAFERDRQADKAARAERERAEEADRKAFEEFRSNRDSAKKDPFKAFATLGLTHDDIAKALLQAPAEPSPVDALQAKLDKLQAKIDADEAARRQSSQQEIDTRNIALVRTNIAKTLEAPEFEATRNVDGGSELVFDVMTSHWEKTKAETGTGEVLPYKQAAAAVESYLEKIAAKATETAKWKARSNPAAAKAEAPKAQKTPEAKGQRPITITNKINADTPPGNQPSDNAANRERAIRVLTERMAAKRAAQGK